MDGQGQGLQIPVERLLLIIGRLTAENEMLRELVAQKMTTAPARAAAPEKESAK